MKDNFDQHKWFKNQYLNEGVYTDIDGPNPLSVVDDMLMDVRSKVNKDELIDLLKTHLRHLTNDFQ